MSSVPAARVAGMGLGAYPYQRHRPETMGRVLGIVYRVIAMHLVKQVGFTKKIARIGAITLNQRFRSVLNPNMPQSTLS